MFRKTDTDPVFLDGRIPVCFSLGGRIWVNPPAGVGLALLLGLNVLLDSGLPLLLVPLVDRVDLASRLYLEY